MSLKRYIYLNFVTTLFLYVNGNPFLNENNPGECILPIYPPKGKWAIIGTPDANPGSKVPFNTILTFSCDEKYKLSSDYSVITCLGSNWDLPPPQCLLTEGRSKRRKRGEEIKGEIIGIGGDGGDASVGRGDEGRGDEGRGEGRGAAVGGRGGDGVVLGDAAGIVTGKLTGKGGRGGEGRAGRPSGRGEGVGGRGGDGLVIGTRRRRDVEVQIQPVQEDKETLQVKRQLFGSSNGYYGGETYNSGGGRGGDGIVIGSGGRKTVIGPGEEGSSNYDESGVARGGQGGTGVVRGGSGSQGGSGWNGNTGQGGDGLRGQDGLVIGNGETVNGYAIGVGQPGGSGEQTGGRGGDGAVVNGGGRVNGVLIGVGGDGGSSGSNNKNKGQQGGKTDVGQGSRPGGISGGTNGYSGQGGFGQSGFGQGGFRQDGYGQEETFNGRGQNRAFTGGRGGTGLVIRGGTVGGTVVGIGGNGGSSGGYYRKKRETHAEEVNPTLLEGEKEKALSKSQEDQVRTKRQSRLKSITTTQHVYVTVIKDGQTYMLSSSQGNHDPWNGQGGTSIGGTGGTGVSLFNNPELDGVLVGFGGQGGHTYIKRNRREVGEKNKNILNEEREAKIQNGERIKRQASINGITYPGPILVGGKGGEGVIINGGVIEGFVVGYGGQGGSPNHGRRRREIQQSFPDL